MLKDLVADIREKDGQLRSFAWPGGYPIVYQDRYGCDMCPDCANKDGVNEDQAPIAYYTHYEGPAVICEGCNKSIESAYGDPGEESEE